jgi:hypothetical protein
MTDAPTPPPSPSQPPGGRVGVFPAIGCVVVLLALLVVFGTAVGGSLQSLAILGVLIVGGGIGLIVFLIRRNRS